MTEQRKYFGTDGIRGTVGNTPVDAAFIQKLAWAVGTVLRTQTEKRPHVLIGKDTRISGYMFESALESGLIAAGVDVLLIGVLPTPGVAYLTRTFRADLGIVITASHNPYTDNGIKFFARNGSKISDETEAHIETLIDTKPFTTVPSDMLGRAERIVDAAGRYIEFCKSCFPAAIDLSSQRIALDCAYGATYFCAPHVFRELGADVHVLHDTPDGTNINSASGTLHLSALSEAVRHHKCTLGIAFDGDGDRVLLVDRNGTVIDGDGVLYILGTHWKKTGRLRNNSIVGTHMSNEALVHALHAHDMTLIRSAVGDRYVREAMATHDSVLGGEPSGHIVCSDRTTTGDGIIAALQVLAVLQETGSDIQTLLREYSPLPSVLRAVRTQHAADILSAAPYQDICNNMQAIAAQHNGRILVRASGTEPKIRILVESNSPRCNTETAQKIADVITTLDAEISRAK